jgi:hypothetical protein
VRYVGLRRPPLSASLKSCSAVPAIYHFTDIRDLERILADGELRAHRSADCVVDTGDATIKSRRMRVVVTCGPGGKVCAYVPFYFVEALIDGFETPYGLELLATTHWVAVHDGARDPSTAAQLVRQWSPRKARLFTDEHVAVAWQRLEEGGWLAGARSPVGV